jgi:hypothetical protein
LPGGGGSLPVQQLRQFAEDCGGETLWEHSKSSSNVLISEGKMGDSTLNQISQFFLFTIL